MRRTEWKDEVINVEIIYGLPKCIVFVHGNDILETENHLTGLHRRLRWGKKQGANIVFYTRRSRTVTVSNLPNKLVLLACNLS